MIKKLNICILLCICLSTIIFSMNINKNAYASEKNEVNLNNTYGYEATGNEVPTISYPDNISIKAVYDGYGMEIYLNGERIGAESSSIVGTGKGFATGDINNLIEIQLAFGDGTIGSVVVNDTEITLPNEEKDRVSFTVKPASEYRILVKKSRNTSDIPRTIIWDSDKENNSSLKDSELIKNGTVEIIDIKDKNGNSVGLDTVKQDLKKNNGWASIIPGYKVIFRLKPDYGYQLTSITINDEKLIAGKEQSTFEYTMPDTNVHISGIFEKVDDKVNNESKKIKNGKIVIDGKEIDSGSVVLSVNDAKLSENQINNFENNANNYKIMSYLDIKLNQVLYKGTENDTWVNKIDKLNNNAKIALQLENGVDGNEVVIIHEKHDGTYEIIPTVFDSNTNTITFETSSFSNYAIASKTVENKENTAISDNTENIKNPKTGDNIVMYTVVALISIIGIFVIRRK